MSHKYQTSGGKGARGRTLKRGFLFRIASLCALACLPVPAQGDFAFEQSEQKVSLFEDGRPVLVFNHGHVQPPGKGTPRSGYLHPLFGLDGDQLTEDFPPKHLHHRGVYFGWPRMRVEGRKVDSWHLRGLLPDFENVDVLEANDRIAAFEASNIWRLDGKTAALREQLRFTVHASDETGQAIDVHATFTNLTAGPVILNGSPNYAFGGINVRLNGARSDAVFATARGLIAESTDFIDPPSPWADQSSRPAAEKPHSGVAIFQHPGNPDYPSRYWTVRPYGFLGAVWPGERDHAIAPGESVDLRYRLFVHRGTAEEAKVAERFETYARENSQRSG